MNFSRTIITLLLPSISTFFSCRQQQATISPLEEAITESVYASATIKSRGQYQLYPTVSGTIKEILVNEGDTVQKGTPLLVVENETARLNAENAGLAAAYSDLGNNAGKLRELKTATDLAANKLQNDSILFRRQQNLWAQGIGSRNELEQRELAYRNSQGNYEAATLRYQELKRQLEFLSRQSKKNLQISNRLQNDFIIRSESDGKVYRLLREKGESVNPQVPVATIGAAGDFMLELSVDEYDIARVRTGQQILLTLDSYRGQVFEAVVDKINPIMDERSRSFLVEASFTKSPETLYPNLSAEANIIISTKEKALTIPRNYLVEDSFVLLENRERRKVTTGLKDYRKVEILGGLGPSEKIIQPGK